MTEVSDSLLCAKQCVQYVRDEYCGFRFRSLDDDVRNLWNDLVSSLNKSDPPGPARTATREILLTLLNFVEQSRPDTSRPAVDLERAQDILTMVHSNICTFRHLYELLMAMPEDGQGFTGMYFPQGTMTGNGLDRTVVEWFQNHSCLDNRYDIKDIAEGVKRGSLINMVIAMKDQNKQYRAVGNYSYIMNPLSVAADSAQLTLCDIGALRGEGVADCVLASVIHSSLNVHREEKGRIIVLPDKTFNEVTTKLQQREKE